MSLEDIPLVLRQVEAEVLQADTPPQLVKLAAGKHQAIQRDMKQCTMEDVVRYLIQCLLRKRDKRPGGKHVRQ